MLKLFADVVSTVNIKFDGKAAKSYFSTIFKRPDVGGDQIIAEEENAADIRQASDEVAAPSTARTVQPSANLTAASPISSRKKSNGRSRKATKPTAAQISTSESNVQLTECTNHPTEEPIAASSLRDGSNKRQAGGKKKIAESTESAPQLNGIRRSKRSKAAPIAAPVVESNVEKRLSRAKAAGTKKKQNIASEASDVKSVSVKPNVKVPLATAQPKGSLFSHTRIMRLGLQAGQRLIYEQAAHGKQEKKLAAKTDAPEQVTPKPLKRSTRTYKLLKKCGSFGFELDRFDDEWYVSLVAPKSSAFRKLVINDRIDGMNGILIDRHTSSEEMENLLASENVLSIKISRIV